jgi:pimeloyl-ACP methyl ester carboxylesterase
MMTWHFRLSLLIMGLGLIPLIAEAQRPVQPEVVLIYKDGFTIKGRVHEKANVITDSASGRSIPIFTGQFFIDDHVRNILFSRDQVQSITKIKPVPPRMMVRFDKYVQAQGFSPKWEFEGFGEWNEKGERTASWRIPRPFNMLQRVSYLTPHHIFAITNDYPWDLYFFTQEFGPTLTRDILYQTFKDKKEFKAVSEGEKLLRIAAFLQEAGWFDEAEKDLQNLVDNFPAEKKQAQEQLDQIKGIRATLFVERIERASNVGQHQEAIERLKIYDKAGFAKLVGNAHQMIIQNVREKYDTANSDMKKVRSYLDSFPQWATNKKVWAKACEFMIDELNYDTIEKLAFFIKFAEEHETQRKKNVAPKYTPDEILASAINGWLQGKNAADPDVKIALKLIHARQLILDYLKTNSLKDRADFISNFKKEINLPADEFARVIRMIPPSHALDPKKITSDVMTLKIEAPENTGGSYLVQLPPNYHPMRSYPVLVLLSGNQEKAEVTLKRFTEEAAKQGYILVAPLWADGKANRAKLQYGDKEHNLVLDTLRDLRRRLQIDSDRVFLYGWEEGGILAFDIALGHPDLFAGVIPMNGFLQTFTRRHYWPNAQYLPMYIIEGDRNVIHCKQIRDVMKDWKQDPYSVTYVEYKGRITEWFSWEVPTMFQWMSRKKRPHPTKELGRHNPKGGLGEEFRSSRNFDNRFYWLSTDGINERNQFHHHETPKTFFTPATFQAYMSSGNRIKKNEALVWSQMDLRISGVKQVTVLLTLNMMDFDKPLVIRVNGGEIGGKRQISPSVETILDELAYTGDRQRLIVAKINVPVPR